MDDSHFDGYMFQTGWFNHQLSNHLLQLEFDKIIFGYLSGHPVTVVSPPACQDMCRKLKPEIGRGQKNDKIGGVGNAKKKIGLQVLALKTDAMEPGSHWKNLHFWVPC